jgi:O-antigen/teichoic acid export membrane protein
MEGGKGYLKGAAILGAAAIISKLLGTLQKIPLQNLAGEEAFGIYNIVYPLYTLILTLAIAGFPLTVSAFVSESLAAGHPQQARRVLRVASASLLATGLLTFTLLYSGADTIARLLGASQTAPAIRSISWALLMVPVMAALRGYFQGYGNMIPTAVSQVVEQLVRVAIMLSLLLLFLRMGYGADQIAAGATFGSTAGAFAGLLVMVYYFWRERRADKLAAGRAAGRLLSGAARTAAASDQPHLQPLEQERTGALLLRFAKMALPVCLSAIALPALTLVDSATLPRLLLGKGMDEAAALHQVGLFNHAQPLVQLVTLIATSMTAALVPAIAYARQRGEMTLLRSRTEAAVRVAWLTGLAASFGLAVTAEPINRMLFDTATGSATMAILAFTAVFGTLQIVTASVLIGYGASRLPATYLFAATLFKLLLNLLLVPPLGLAGAAWASVAAYALASLLGLAALRRRVGVSFPLTAYLVRPLAAATAMCAAVFAVRFATYGLARLAGADPTGRGLATATALAAVCLGAVVYAVILLRNGGITRSELAAGPGALKRLLPLLERLRLLPPE